MHGFRVGGHQEYLKQLEAQEEEELSPLFREIPRASKEQRQDLKMRVREIRAKYARKRKEATSFWF